MIAIGLAGVGGGVFKYLRRKKDNNDQLPAQNS
ncbi:MAG: LPXTG cell wall anchor domain-containing protein [Bacteroidales bacterium]|nr:LPXTG cell wall anchor domain-containing protein [Bacteroidales bacterium]MDD3666567.1 LPXTG cell wall anchor domain-containing protein [Bacteroidales bacterium]